MVSCITQKRLLQWLNNHENATKITNTKNRKFQKPLLEKVLYTLYKNLGKREGYGTWVDDLMYRNITTSNKSHGTGLLHVNSDEFVLLNAFCLKLGVRLLVESFVKAKLHEVYIPCDRGKPHYETCLIKKLSRVTYYQMLNPNEFSHSFTFAHIKGKVYVIHNLAEYDRLSKRHSSYEPELSMEKAEQLIEEKFNIPKLNGTLHELYKNPSTNPIASSKSNKRLIILATDCFLGYSNPQKRIDASDLHILGELAYLTKKLYFFC